jgi:uncharacterized membrane protein YgcG
MKTLGFKAIGSFILAATLSTFSWATTTSPRPALPGTLNYVEGSASIGNQSLSSNSIGSADLAAGQILATQNGKAEVLLTPGVFLRLDDNSAVKMISPSITNTELDVNQGNALIEVSEIHPENDIRISEDGATTRLLKTGLYGFDAAQDQLRVFDGKAVVHEGQHQITVKGGHELALNADGKLKAQKFNKKEYEQSDLYRWSSLRSSYLAEANMDAARIYVSNGWYGPGWGAGWFWDPWFSAYTFLPGDGLFYSPFGWGFYSPGFFYRSGFYGAGYGYGYFHHFGPGYHAPGQARAFGGESIGGFRGGSSLHAESSGGFHGGGGFGGGGFGGGRR